MSIIAMIGNKGGTGKTTLSINIATALSKKASVALIDADPQRSALQWSVMRECEGDLPVIEGCWNLDDVISHTSSGYDYVIIDCPPSIHSIQSREALDICDMTLIPVQPSPYDLWATVRIEREIEVARQSNPGLSAMLVMNQVEPRTRLSRYVYQGLAEIDLPAANTAIYRRVAYKSSVLEGSSVHEMGSRARVASEEIHELIDEVIQQ